MTPNSLDVRSGYIPYWDVVKTGPFCTIVVTMCGGPGTDSCCSGQGGTLQGLLAISFFCSCCVNCIAMLQNAKGSVEVAAKCFYRRKDLPQNLLIAADRHTCEPLEHT